MTVIRLQDGKAIVEDGKIGTEQACCCEQGCPCQIPLPAGMVPNVSAVITFPNVAGDCPAGQYAVAFDLSLFMGTYDGEGEINLGGTIFSCVDFSLRCFDQQWRALLGVFTGRCNQVFHRCTIGNGGFIGTGTTINLPSYVQDGVCLPSPTSLSVVLELDVVYDFTLTFN